MSDNEGSAFQLELLRQQTVFAEFGRLALQSNDLTEVLTEACRIIADGLGTELAKVLELQTDGLTLLVRAGVGWNPGVVGHATVQAVETSSEGQALWRGEPMISDDIETDTRFKYAQFLFDHGVRAVANVPIIGAQGRLPFGILQIDSRVPRRFTSDDTSFLNSYANLLAAAVDRLRVLDGVREGEVRLQLALEAGKLGRWELDLATGSTSSSPRTMQIFGLTGDPPMRWDYRGFMRLVLPEDRARIGRTIGAVLQDATAWHFECRICRASDGAVHWIEAQGSPAGSRTKDGRPTHLIGIVADITDRKSSEVALRQSNQSLEAMVVTRTRELTDVNARLQTEAAERERVEEALRQSCKMEAVGQLTGGLAHDFNNLLIGITGSLELIRLRMSQGRTDDFDRYIDAAMMSANRAAAVTHRLLAFSRRQTLDPKPTDVNQLVKGMEELFQRTIGPSIQLESELEDRLWRPLCDPNQLESTLLNLVINARDAMPGGGLLTIQSANITLADRRGSKKEQPEIPLPPGDYVVIHVTDSGTGMTPEVISRAFDPFFTTKPIGRGTGLGLSMGYGFVKQTGGYMSLRSEVDQGTTVTLYLPRYTDLGDETLATSLDGASADRRPVVLVVEDEATIRMLVADTLADQGYVVLEAEDGSSGLKIAESKARIDLLITDVGLPNGMNGRQLADAIRQRRRGIKVLFITGYAAGAMATSGLLNEGMQVMLKPFAMDALAARVQGIISSPLVGAIAQDAD